MPLNVCATPIGNLEDVTLRVLRELAEADLVLCEDTRRTRILLDHHGIAARVASIDRRHEARRTAEILPRLVAGDRIALVSDAGLPGISDPGSRLIAAALEQGVPVVVLPGPSAVETALVASGLIGDRYAFVGFVPRTAAGRDRLWDELRAATWPTVAFESPRRLPETLRSLADAAPDRFAAVCRELTKRFEEVVRGTASDLATRFAVPPRGEITLVVGPAVGGGARTTSGQAAAAVEELVAAGASRRAAARVVARLTGASSNELYRSSL
jgi:16S rRNA (cytidine1402-2'-O)-methyltransferase